MTERALAGRWDPRGGGVTVGALADAVRGAGRPGAVERGPFALAWAPDASSRSAPAGVLCLLDGTVANAGPLAEELGIAPGTAPEALAAAGWSRWGEQLPARLRGEFVLVAWDGAANRGLVARGGLGQRPLFLVRAGPAVLFASEVRDLLALLPRRPAPDRLAVAHWLARTGLREGRTLHEGVTRLEPGSMLVLSGDAATTRRFWAPSYTPPDAWSQTEAADALRAGMRTAVARALQGAQPTGILLSGGFDSGTAAALAAEVAERPPPAYSAVFPDHPEVDESERIAAVRAGLGLGGVTADVRPASPMRAALEFQAEWQTPCVSPNWFVWSPLLRRAAEDGVATLLDGEGGDEVLGCAPYLIADRLRRGRLRAATRLARSLPGMGPTPDPRVVRRALVPPSSPMRPT